MNRTVTKLSVLGSTGSIGRTTLEVVRQFPERFQVVGLAAGCNVDLLKKQIDRFRPAVAAVRDEAAADMLARFFGGSNHRPEIVWGSEGYRQVAALDAADTVVSAIVGAAGLEPTLAAVEAGKRLALANKEALVAAGRLVTERAKARGVDIIPVDSEHSAIFQSLQGNPRNALKRILLTASGGPFLRATPEELARVTPEAALKHPNWSMGRKITVDSASLMNKGLEVIEACWLFDVSPDRIAVHVHPESIVHSMVEYVDGSVIAQLGVPDMKIPIAYALTWPDRLPVEAPVLDLFELRRLTFFPPDMEKFPCLRLAYEACREGGTAPAVLNAADEVAVHAFLEHRLAFTDIPRLIESLLNRHQGGAATTLEAVLDADRWAREEALKLAAAWCR